MLKRNETQRVTLYIKRVANRRFVATTNFRQQQISGKAAGQRPKAIENLEAALEAAGAPWLPIWEPVEVDAAPEKESEYDPQTIVRPVTPAAPKTDKGWTTPSSDPEVWEQFCSQTIAMVDSLGFTTDEDSVSDYRDKCDKVMRSLGCRGPFERSPSGDRYIRQSKIADPTVRRPRRGEGRRRERHHKTIDGNFRDVSPKGSRPSKPATQSGKARSEDRVYSFGTEEQRTAAFAAGKSAGQAAKAAGWTSEAQRVAFKLVTLESLARMGLPMYQRYVGSLTRELDAGIEGLSPSQVTSLRSRLDAATNAGGGFAAAA